MDQKPTYVELEQRVKELEKAFSCRVIPDKQLKLLSLAVDQSSEGIVVVDLDGNLEYLNNAFAKMHGYLLEELVGKNLSIFHTPEQMRSVEAANLELKRNGSFKGEIWHVKRDGTLFPTLMHNSLIRDDTNVPIGMMGTIRDITDIKQKEKALRESEERFKETVDLLPSIVSEYDTEGRCTYVNTYGLEVFGYTPDDLEQGLYVSQMFLPEEIGKHKDRFSSLLKGDIPPSTEYSLQCKDGSIIYILANSAPIYKDEKIVGVRSSATPITERKRVEEALQLSEEKYRSFIENAPVGMYTLNTKGEFTYGNKKLLEITGYKTEDWLNKPFHPIVHPDDLALVIEKATGRLAGKEIANPHETRIFNSSGEIMYVRLTARSIYDTDEKDNKNVVGIQTFVEDITSKKLAEEALRESEAKLTRAKKMEALGLLAGGVAHDLNNVLSGIVSYPELILMDLPEDSKFRKPIETIKASGHRAAAIVQDLLTVARGVAISKEPLNLNAIVDTYLLSPEFEKLNRFHPTVTIMANLDNDLFNIRGSDTHLRKVVMNLVSNASEAMERGGDVIISTMNRYVDRPIRGYDDVNVGEYAVLSVSDNGSGISPDDLERIFEPFYTKKVMGRSGTGLGLAVVWNVVQDLKGYLDVISDENGTTFELYFPITRDEISDTDLSIPINDYKGDGETVLVVDDMESQREIACKMLDTLGYKAKAVSSGEEAVEYLTEHTVDLILLDMIMDPGINGRETYEQIIKIHPNQKAVIASGFAETEEVKEAQRSGAGQYLKKPLTLEKMGIAVRDELKKQRTHLHPHA